MKEPPGLASGEASPPRTRAAAAGLCAHGAWPRCVKSEPGAPPHEDKAPPVGGGPASVTSVNPVTSVNLHRLL